MRQALLGCWAVDQGARVPTYGGRGEGMEFFSRTYGRMLGEWVVIFCFGREGVVPCKNRERKEWEMR